MSRIPCGRSPKPPGVTPASARGAGRQRTLIIPSWRSGLGRTCVALATWPVTLRKTRCTRKTARSCGTGAPGDDGRPTVGTQNFAPLRLDASRGCPSIWYLSRPFHGTTKGSTHGRTTAVPRRVPELHAPSFSGVRRSHVVPVHPTRHEEAEGSGCFAEGFEKGRSRPDPGWFLRGSGKG